MNLPENTYYKQGILINGNRHKNNINKENTELKKTILILKEELENANKRINELSNK